ncbi:MAG: restriction endonuclease [Desulfocucumaceae bacterium]
MTSGIRRGKRVVFFDRWREKRRSSKYIGYYIKPAGNGRNILARKIDFYGIILAAIIVTFLILASYAGSPVRAAYLTVPLAIPLVFIAFKIRMTMDNRSNEHKRLWRAGWLCQERIKKIGSKEDLDRLLAEVLEKLPGFSDVHIVLDDLGGEGDKVLSMSVRAVHNGKPVIVGGITYESSGSSIPAERVLQFTNSMRGKDIPEGILVAVGEFSEEARRASKEGRIRIALVDLYNLVELSRQAGHSIFHANQPEGEAVGALLRQRYKKFFRFALGRNKAKRYLFAAGLLLTMYYTAIRESMLGAGYLAFAAVNLILFIYCVLSNREIDIS